MTTVALRKIVSRQDYRTMEIVFDVCKDPVSSLVFFRRKYPVLFEKDKTGKTNMERLFG